MAAVGTVGIDVTDARTTRLTRLCIQIVEYYDVIGRHTEGCN